MALTGHSSESVETQFLVHVLLLLAYYLLCSPTCLPTVTLPTITSTMHLNSDATLYSNSLQEPRGSSLGCILLRFAPEIPTPHSWIHLVHPQCLLLLALGLPSSGCLPPYPPQSSHSSCSSTEPDFSQPSRSYMDLQPPLCTLAS